MRLRYLALPGCSDAEVRGIDRDLFRYHKTSVDILSNEEFLLIANDDNGSFKRQQQQLE